MPSWKDFYGSKYLSAKMIGTKPIKAKIAECEPETLTGADKEEKTRLVITLEGEEKKLPINATNAKRLGDAWGDNYLKWVGKRVVVTKHKVRFADNDVDGLCVTPDGK